MGLSEVLILVMAVAGFAAGYLAAVLRHGDTKVGTPSASHNTHLDEIALLRRQQDAVLGSSGDVRENVRKANEIEERIAQLRQM